MLSIQLTVASPVTAAVRPLVALLESPSVSNTYTVIRCREHNFRQFQHFIFTVGTFRQSHIECASGIHFVNRKAALGTLIPLRSGEIRILPCRQKIGSIFFRFNGLVYVPVRRVDHQGQVLRGAGEAHADLPSRLLRQNSLRRCGLHLAFLCWCFRSQRLGGGGFRHGSLGFHLHRFRCGLGFLDFLGKHRGHQLERQGHSHQPCQQLFHNNYLLPSFLFVHRQKSACYIPASCNFPISIALSRSNCNRSKENSGSFANFPL